MKIVKNLSQIGGKVVDIICESRPAWLELNVRGNPLSLVLRLHQDLTSELREHLSTDSGLFNNLGNPDGFELDEFTDFSVDEVWGYGQVIKPESEFPPFLRWSAEIPENVIDHTDDNPCQNYRTLNNFSHTLALLQHVVSPHDDSEIEVSESPRNQLVVCRFHHSKGMSGGSLSVDVSIDLALWLAKLDNEIAERLIASSNTIMAMTYGKMVKHEEKISEVLQHSFRTQYDQGGGIHFSVPGDACGLDPAYNRMSQKGYRLSPHNVDNFIQQMTLLMAVANLCDFYRNYQTAVKANKAIEDNKWSDRPQIGDGPLENEPTI